MLKVIDEVLDTYIKNSEKQIRHFNIYVDRLLHVMDEVMSTLELMEKLHLKSRSSFREHYLKPALDNGLIKMAYPDKPNSKNQRYYKIKKKSFHLSY